MTMLTVVQKACKRIGIESPNAVQGSTDNQITQLLALLNEDGEELRSRYRWSRLIKTDSFTTVATASQGTLDSIVTDSDLDYIINETLWNQTTRRPVFGPLYERDWQILQASPVTGPYHHYRITGNTLYFDPVPSAGDTIAFSYYSTKWVESAGGDAQTETSVDTDTFYFDENILVSGLVWRWKQVKGFDYAEDFQKYERLVKQKQTTDGTKPVINMAGGINNFQPGIFIPSGNWNP